MSPGLEATLARSLAGSPLEPQLAASAAPLLERYGDDPALARLDPAVARGLARVVASSGESARFLANRSGLVARLPALGADSLARRGAELEREAPVEPAGDLELFLDELRLLRREETLIAACLDLGGLVPFESVSRFLSVLAEAILRRALRAASAFGTTRASAPLSVVGMGKIAGREFSYHSDLDLIFLYGGDVAELPGPSRLAQRLIAYLATMTGAGVAYAVDARLRPSGQQGLLVTSFASFERYQREEAQTWEHLALLVARAVAGDVVRTQAVVERARESVLARAENPWRYVGQMRERVERERAHETGGRLDLKTGPGGLMDAEFLAQGAMLERGAKREAPALPATGALLRAAAAGPRVERVMQAYSFLRRVEARARWLAGRAVETVRRDHPRLPLLAELVEPGLTPEAFLARVDAERRTLRRAFRAVVEAESVEVLER